jgi:DNA-directed RNA polymerase specialized sigma24 family protein
MSTACRFPGQPIEEAVERIIRAFCRRQRHPRVDVESIAQAGRIAAWLAQESYVPGPGRDLRRHVSVSVSYAMYLEDRTQIGRPGFSRYDMPPPLPLTAAGHYGDQEGGFAEVERRLAADALWGYVRCLSAPEREALVRLYLLQQPYREVAQGMGVSEERVSTLRRFGLTRLRRIVPAGLREEVGR